MYTLSLLLMDIQIISSVLVNKKTAINISMFVHFVPTQNVFKEYT